MNRAAALLLFSSAAFAQSTGTISGKIVDDLGIPVSGAAVVAANAAGQEFKTTAQPTGGYTLENLSPGRYQLAFTMATMKKLEQKDFIVEPGKTASLNVTMRQSGMGVLGEDDRFSAAFFDALPKRPVPQGPAPRLADGTPDLSGFWLFGRGDPPVANAPVAPPPEEPMPRPWAEAIRKERQTNNLRDDPYARCLPGSIINKAGYGRFVHFPGFLAMQQNPLSYENPRQIFIDGRSHPQDTNPTWKGHSVGHWEGDTLVIDTVGFNGLQWYNGGLASTEDLHVIERYRRPDLGHLEIEMTVEDPALLQKPWTRKLVSHLDPDGDILEEVCVENNKDPEHMVGK